MPPSGTPSATSSTTANAAAATDTDNTTPTTNENNNNNNNNLSLIFDSPDEIDNDISASIDFSQCQSPSFSVPPFLTQQDHHQFDLPLVQSQIQLPADVVDENSQYGGGDHHQGFVAAGAPLMGPPPPLPSLFDDDCLSSMPSYVPLNPSSPSCSFLAPSMAAPFMPMNALTAGHNSGFFAAGTILSAPHELLPQDLEFQGDNGGIFCPDSMQRIFKPGDLQVNMII